MSMDSFCFHGWEALLSGQRREPYFEPLCRFVEEAYRQEEVYPPRDELFEALRLTPPEAVRCVILGQDPYHEPGQAHGLSFSVKPGVALPRSLANIYKELQADLGAQPPADGSLLSWARQGVLLLNTTLTVRRGAAGSHRSFGWQHFTDAVLQAVDTLPQPVVYVLWGGDARKKTALLRPRQNRLVIESAHPSPLSAYRGFFGSRPFSRINDFLLAQGEEPIRWV